VATRYHGIIDDFVVLNALRTTNAAGAAITLLTASLPEDGGVVVS